MGDGRDGGPGPSIEPAHAATLPWRTRRRLVVIVTALAVIAAGVGFWAYTELAAASLSVSTVTPFVAAGDPVPFRVSLEGPWSQGLGRVTWEFGDGGGESNGTQVAYAYPFPGNFFVGTAAWLTNGRGVDNFHALFPMQVGPPRAAPNPLGSMSSQGVISVNESASSAGAPLVAVGGTVQFVGGIGQSPTFFYATETDAATNAWENYTWAPIRMVMDFGDGSPVQSTANVTGAFVERHTYLQSGIFGMTLQVTTANFSAAQVNGLPSQPTWARVAASPVQVTTVGQSVAVGDYRLVTYAGGVVNPGVLTDVKEASGGYLTLDPAISYFGDATIPNVYEALLAFNGTRTDDFIPVVADSIPTRNNGGISSDFRNYTFHVRPGLTFTDGTNVTAYDVKYSLTRTLLFTYGAPPTPGYILAQYLLPAKPDGTWDLSYASVNAAITTDDAAQTVTLHLTTPTVPLVVYQILSTLYGPWIVSHTWLERVGPTLVWSDAGFRDYQKYAVAPQYVSAWQNGATGSGPYMIDYTANPDAVVLKANPTYVPVPGRPRPSVGQVVIDYVADPHTRELALQVGQADIAGIDPQQFGDAVELQRAGLVNIRFAPTLSVGFLGFNMEIAQSSEGPNTNPFGNHVPPDFFVDLNMRKAFSYAFNFDQYINETLGNAAYNATFGVKFSGFIPEGMVGHEDLSPQLAFDMKRAHDFYNQTAWVKARGWANSGFTVSISVDGADLVDSVAAASWAQNLESLAPGITVNVALATSTELITDAVPHANPVAIYAGGWSPDYPFPTGMIVPLLLPGTAAGPYGGAFPGFTGFNISYFANDANGTNQVSNMTQMLNWIEDSVGSNATNLTRVVADSQRTQEMGMNLTIYVPTVQQYTFFTYRTWIQGMDLQTNPMLGGAVILYALLSKGSLSTTTLIHASAGSAFPIAMPASGFLILPGAASASTILRHGTKEREEGRTRCGPFPWAYELRASRFDLEGV